MNIYIEQLSPRVCKSIELMMLENREIVLGIFNRVATVTRGIVYNMVCKLVTEEFTTIIYNYVFCQIEILPSNSESKCLAQVT